MYEARASGRQLLVVDSQPHFLDKHVDNVLVSLQTSSHVILFLLLAVLWRYGKSIMAYLEQWPKSLNECKTAVQSIQEDASRLVFELDGIKDRLQLMEKQLENIEEDIAKCEYQQQLDRCKLMDYAFRNKEVG